MKEQRMRFWIETAAAALTGSLSALTLVWRDWIEAVLGVSPDRHDGSFEWLTVAALMTLTLALAVIARAEARRPVRGYIK